MNTHAFGKKLQGLKERFGLQLFVLAAIVCTGWIVTDHAGAVYILTGPEDAAIVLNEEAQAAEGTLSSQLLHLSSGQSGYDMKLTAARPSPSPTTGRPSPPRPAARRWRRCWTGSTSPPAPWRWWPWRPRRTAPC